MRSQKNVTLSQGQQDFCRANYLKLNKREIARALNVSYNVIVINMVLMGLCKEDRQKVWEPRGKFFNVDEFGLLYAV